MCELFVENINEIPEIDVGQKLSEFPMVYEKYNDRSQGVYPCLRIETPEQLEHWFQSIYKLESQKSTIYRGQSNSNWKVTSSLEREIYKKYPNGLSSVENYQEIANDILAKFKNSLRGKVNEQFLLTTDSLEFNNEIWAIGQHHGLKTPLIDWTRSFYTALFFAFGSKEHSKYRSVTRILEGLFTYWGVEHRLKKNSDFIDDYIRDKEEYRHITNARSKIMTKYYINNALSEYIRKKLNHLGITYETVYPDLMGSISNVNSKVEEVILNSQNNHLNSM